MHKLPHFFLTTNSVAIPAIKTEWKPKGRNLIHKQFPIMLSWAYIIHKLKGKTLDMAVIDLSKSEKCSGITLAALSSVHKLGNLLLHINK